MRTLLAIAFFILIVITGVCSITIASAPNSNLATHIQDFGNAIYVLHLACWMILGMVSNYLWDIFRAGKGMADVSLPGLLLPILVSPIVFFAILSHVKSGPPDINLSWALVAFQNGFFWQVIFSKAGAGPAAPRVESNA